MGTALFLLLFVGLVHAWDEPERFGYRLGRLLRATRVRSIEEAELLRNREIAEQKSWSKSRKARRLAKKGRKNEEGAQG